MSAGVWRVRYSNGVVGECEPHDGDDEWHARIELSDGCVTAAEGRSASHAVQVAAVGYCDRRWDGDVYVVEIVAPGDASRAEVAADRDYWHGEASRALARESAAEVARDVLAAQLAGLREVVVREAVATERAKRATRDAAVAQYGTAGCTTEWALSEAEDEVDALLAAPPATTEARRG